MTVETKIDLSRKIATDWVPQARRQGERAGRVKLPQLEEDRDDDVVVAAPVAPAPVWPRVFPGI